MAAPPLAIALAVPRQVERRLVAEIVRHGHQAVARCDGAADLASALSGGGCDVAVVAAAPGYLDRDLLAASDAAGVRVVGLVATDAERRLAASVGLVELLPVDSEWEALEQALLGAPATTPREPVRGQVISVWGPAGAPGRTTVAITIAAEIAAAGYSVALADADTHSASVAPSLGLLDESPGFAAACRLAGANALDLAELERIGQRYLSGHGSFWVLTGIGRPSRWPELSTERVVGTVRACRDWVDYTVIDTGFSLENDEEISSDLFAPRRNAATIAALREADHVVAVGSADPVGMSRFLRAHVDLIETLLTDRLTVVMNRVRSGAIGLNPTAQVQQTLRRFGGIENAVLLPHDQSACDAAVLSGRTLRDAAPRSPVLAALGQFVGDRILPARITEPRTRRSLRLRPVTG